MIIYISSSVPHFVPHYGTFWHKYTFITVCHIWAALWYIVAQVYIRNSVPYFMPCYSTLWHKYALEKVGTSTKVGVVEQEFSMREMRENTFVKVGYKWGTLGSKYTFAKVEYKWGKLGYKYTLEKVESTAKVGAVEQECSAILDLLTFPFARYACKA